MNDLKNAKALLAQCGCTCALCKGSIVLTDFRHGVKPLLELLASEKDLRGFSAADRVVGKAAAHLYRLMGITAVYAGVISHPARIVLEAAGIEVYWQTAVPTIQNRSHTGPCPMESAVWDIEDSPKALVAIQAALAELQNK